MFFFLFCFVLFFAVCIINVFMSGRSDGLLGYHGDHFIAIRHFQNQGVQALIWQTMFIRGNVTNQLSFLKHHVIHKTLFTTSSCLKQFLETDFADTKYIFYGFTLNESLKTLDFSGAQELWSSRIIFQNKHQLPRHVSFQLCRLFQKKIGLLHLKSIHPLWKILEKCTIWGV